jgi:hypothetical protein
VTRAPIVCPPHAPHLSRLAMPRIVMPLPMRAMVWRLPTAQRQAADVLRMKAERVRPVDIARRLGIGRASVYRILAAAAGGFAAVQWRRGASRPVQDS